MTYKERYKYVHTLTRIYLKDPTIKVQNHLIDMFNNIQENSYNQQEYWSFIAKLKTTKMSQSFLTKTLGFAKKTLMMTPHTYRQVNRKKLLLELKAL